MFARIVRMHLRPEHKEGFTRAIETEVMPALKKFSGFTGEVLMVSPDGKEGIGISLWERREDAEAYDQRGYAGVLKMLEKYTEPKPELRTYDVTYWNVEKVPVRKAA